MSANTPLSPSVRSQFQGFQRSEDGGHEEDAGVIDDSWRKFRPGTSPAACTSPGSESLRTARPWTVSLASVKSFTSGSLAADSWSELLYRGVEEPWRVNSEPLNPRTDFLSKSLVSKTRASCEEYRLSKREDDLRAFNGLWSAMSFRRPRGMDVLSERARVARKPAPPVADGFVQQGPTSQTPFEIAQQSSVLQKLDNEHFTLIKRIVEADALHFVSAVAGQVLYREQDPVENAYILLSGSVQQFSRDMEFLRSMGWHPHVEHSESTEDKRLARQASSRQFGTPRDEYNPREFPTLTEHVRRKRTRDVDRQSRFRTLEGHSVFCQDSSHGNLFNTATATGALVGEPALIGEKVWRHTALCLKDCEFLVIDGTIFKQVLASVRETQRFFDLYLPGIRIIPKKDRKRPHPMEYWKQEHLPQGESILEEGSEPMEPLVFMVLKGKLELKRNRYSGSNLAYVLAMKPLRGRPVRMTTKDIPSVLPEIARSFVADLDEDGLPRIGLPPPLKGSLRHKLERQYWADPTNFVPDIKDIKKSLTKEQAKVHNHKVLLKERIESTAARRRDRILKREEAAREARPLREEDIEDSDTRLPEEVEQIKALLEYVQSLQAARPGSPEYVGDGTWSHRPGCRWMAPDMATGPISRPLSSQMIHEPESRTSESKQETWAILKPGDVFGSLAFFPLWGVAEPFTVVSASPDCVVASVRGTQEAKLIPKHILKEVRVDFGRSLQKKLSAVVESTALEEPGEKSAAETLTAPSEVPDETPASSERAESPESESPQMSMGASRSIKSTGRLQAGDPSFRPRSAESLMRSGSAGSGASLNSFAKSFDLGRPNRDIKRTSRKSASHPRPSMMRWLVDGKHPKKEGRSFLSRLLWTE